MTLMKKPMQDKPAVAPAAKKPAAKPAARTRVDIDNGLLARFKAEVAGNYPDRKFLNGEIIDGGLRLLLDEPFLKDEAQTKGTGGRLSAKAPIAQPAAKPSKAAAPAPSKNGSKPLAKAKADDTPYVSPFSKEAQIARASGKAKK